MVCIKVAQFFQKIAQKVAQAVFTRQTYVLSAEMKTESNICSVGIDLLFI